MDTKDTRVQNLLFLLSAAPLGMGCIITSGDDSATTDPATTTATGTATGTATDAPMTSGATDPQTTSATGNDTTAGADETTAGVEGPPNCIEYANLNSECYGAEYFEESLQDCSDYYAELMEYYGEDCIDRFNEQLACLSALTCEEFEGDDPCPDQTAAFDDACSPEGTTGGGSTGG